MDKNDEGFMQRALELAEKGRGKVEPNPVVGAVVVKDGKVIGEGFHEYFGGPHAEVNALGRAGVLAKDATLYVSLEPCSSTAKKTPPCVDAVVRSGIKKVVAATIDPNPIALGRGLERLRQEGIEVEVGLLEEAAKALNAPFFKLMTKKMPYVIAKWAMSLDGKIATRTGQSKWISSDESRKHVHRLRALVDGVMVGIGTVKRDAPLLTCRVPGGKNPRRIVVDAMGELSLDSQLVKTSMEVETIVAATGLASKDRLKELEKRGCRVLVLPASGDKVDMTELMKKLGEMQMTNILVEGGGTLMASLFEAGLVDKVMVFVAPKIIGGTQAKSPVMGAGIEEMANALRLRDIRVSRLADDVLIEATVTS